MLVSTMPYEELLQQWQPKITKMKQSFIPYLDEDDIEQELRLVLWKCQRAYSPDRGAVFHTYLHQAMLNTMGKLVRSVGRHNPDYRSLVYLSTLDDFEEGDDRGEGSRPTGAAAIYRQLSEPFEESVRLLLETAGFTGPEVVWVEARLEGLRGRELEGLLSVDRAGVRAIARRSQRKLRRLREEWEGA